MRFLISSLAIAILAISCCNTPKTAVYLDESQPLDKRVEDALSRMTLEDRKSVV